LHVPQLMTPPHPSGASPQFHPSPTQVFGVHPELEEELAAIDDALELAAIDDVLEVGVVEVLAELVAEEEPPELVPVEELTTTRVPHAATARTTAKPKAIEALIFKRGERTRACPSRHPRLNARASREPRARGSGSAPLRGARGKGALPAPTTTE
jgi:hypothetical protein